MQSLAEDPEEGNYLGPGEMDAATETKPGRKVAELL